jgi:two-component system nitrogen regulation response regulator GlnG
MVQTILVVEDDRFLLEIIGTALAEAGYEVRQARDGIAGLREVEAAPPDLVLSDVRMPGLGGAALAERLSQRQRPIPVILMSAVGHAAHHSPHPFIAKPFTLDELLALVEQVLSRSVFSAADSRR